MECSLCKIYLGKANISFNIRLTNHRLEVPDPNAIPACCHFAQDGHNFNNHAKFTLTETINRRSIPVEIMQESL